MAEVAPEIRPILSRYLQKLEQDGLHVRKAFLVGSHASGRSGPWSDIDVALVSDDYEGNRYMDKERIRRSTLAVSSPLAPVPFRTADFTDNNPFVNHIRETGLPLELDLGLESQ
jgi:uncharacterized protein